MGAGCDLASEHLADGHDRIRVRGARGNDLRYVSGPA